MFNKKPTLEERVESLSKAIQCANDRIDSLKDEVRQLSKTEGCTIVNGWPIQNRATMRDIMARLDEIYAHLGVERKDVGIVLQKKK